MEHKALIVIAQLIIALLINIIKNGEMKLNNFSKTIMFYKNTEINRMLFCIRVHMFIVV